MKVGMDVIYGGYPGKVCRVEGEEAYLFLFTECGQKIVKVLSSDIAGQFPAPEEKVETRKPERGKK